ncbi:hypothetical protein B0H14DRAFT_2649801 [Mycena olivaceomarginata]|nr:hypothetical protein B0H14DRAFT_2649801 [Mycena olivaceomarginata]
MIIIIAIANSRGSISVLSSAARFGVEGGEHGSGGNEFGLCSTGVDELHDEVERNKDIKYGQYTNGKNPRSSSEAGDESVPGARTHEVLRPRSHVHPLHPAESKAEPVAKVRRWRREPTVNREIKGHGLTIEPTLESDGQVCKSAEYVGSNWKGQGEAILSQGEKDANDEAQKDGMEGEKEYGHSNRGLRKLSTGDAGREGSSNVKAEGAIASAFVGVAGKELEGVNSDDGGKDNEGERPPQQANEGWLDATPDEVRVPGTTRDGVNARLSRRACQNGLPRLAEFEFGGAGLNGLACGWA